MERNSSIVSDEFAGGKFRPRLWIADVENPRIAKETLPQIIQTVGWIYYKNIREKPQSNSNFMLKEL